MAHWSDEALPAKMVIIGAPRTKKNHQRIAERKDGSPFILQSKQHDAWAGPAILQMRHHWRRPPLPGSILVELCAIIYRARADGDLLNYLAAVSDALQAAAVLENDRQIVSLDGCRLEKDATRPRIELELRLFTGGHERQTLLL